ncbi:MAG: AbrB/MazE/SpoVT family DNA-binding domain-containing protein [Patescibacteria group bacterium]|jgi:bifunctional DNA-binding transcriptional regulator/antitoxin component of YhaV-PrlF toxin-antitoxin module
MNNATTKLSEKYQIVVPKIIRQQMHLTTGMTVLLQPLDANRAILVKHPKDYVTALSGLGQDIWKKLGGVNYIKRARKQWDKSSV